MADDAQASEIAELRQRLADFEARAEHPAVPYDSPLPFAVPQVRRSRRRQGLLQAWLLGAGVVIFAVLGSATLWTTRESDNETSAEPAPLVLSQEQEAVDEADQWAGQELVLEPVEFARLGNGMFSANGADIAAFKLDVPEANCFDFRGETVCEVEGKPPAEWCLGVDECQGGQYNFADGRLSSSMIRVPEYAVLPLVEQSRSVYGPPRTRVVNPRPGLPIQSVHFAWRDGLNFLEIVALGGINVHGERWKQQTVLISQRPPVGIDFRSEPKGASASKAPEQPVLAPDSAQTTPEAGSESPNGNVSQTAESEAGLTPQESGAASVEAEDVSVPQ